MSRFFIGKGRAQDKPETSPQSAACICVARHLRLHSFLYCRSFTRTRTRSKSVKERPAQAQGHDRFQSHPYLIQQRGKPHGGLDFRRCSSPAAFQARSQLLLITVIWPPCNQVDVTPGLAIDNTELSLTTNLLRADLQTKSRTNS